MIVKLLARNKHVILYGISLAFLLFLLKLLEVHFLVIRFAFEIYIGAVAVVFTALGVWLALKLMRPKTQTVFVEKEIYKSEIVEKEIFVYPSPDFTLNQKELDALGVSKRELEVLQLMAEGLSNQEIASKLFVSLNTIKTHSSRLFEKMDVKRRTQAIEKAKKLRLIS